MARPREFEPEEALAAIKQTFWRLGYEGASMHDIETATGLKKQSLYRLYGDKRGMYLQALQHYGENEVAGAGAILGGAGMPKERFEALFSTIIDDALGDRVGCFLCGASLDQAQLDDRTKAVVAAIMEGVRETFAAALANAEPYSSDQERRDKKAGELMAAYFGLRVMVMSGMSVDVIRAAASEALKGI